MILGGIRALGNSPVRWLLNPHDVSQRVVGRTNIDGLAGTGVVCVGVASKKLIVEIAAFIGACVTVVASLVLRVVRVCETVIVGRKLSDGQSDGIVAPRLIRRITPVAGADDKSPAQIRRDTSI